MNRLVLIALLFLKVQLFYGADPPYLPIKSPRDFAILEEFFKMCCSEEEYGYVLYDAKPISIQRFYALDDFPIHKDLKYTEEKFINSLLAREAISLWNTYLASQNTFVLKATPEKNPSLAFPTIQVMFINLPLLEMVIEENIALFRANLNPLTTPKQLAHTIAYSEKSITEILQDNRILEGIVLGFGTHNSLVGGRLENIRAASYCTDCFPYAPRSLLMESRNEHFGYGGYYLEHAGGDNSDFQFSQPLHPSKGFSSILEEAEALNNKEEPVPSALQEQQPRFIFGAYAGGPSNQPLFTKLKKAQKKSQELLKKPDFLEHILARITGNKPLPPTQKLPFSTELLFETMKAEKWTTVLANVAGVFKERKALFLKGLHTPTTTCPPPEMVGASNAMLQGLKKALFNLSEANKYFETLAKDVSLQELEKEQLYCKTTTPGSGEPITGADTVRIAYTVKDLSGTTLFANHDLEIRLSETVCGFAHGVQGMRPGEKRILYIHPSMGYGALTTLPPCSPLIVHVHLLDKKERLLDQLPVLTPHSFKWLEDPKFLRDIETSLEKMPVYAAHFYSRISKERFQCKTTHSP